MEIAVPEVGSLTGDLSVPDDARGTVLFAHGSGSSRKSPRNVQVAEALQGRGLATLLIDLLTPDEAYADEVDGRHRFDIPLLAERLELAIHQLEKEPSTSALPLGCFGASTGAAAALVAAARLPERIGAVVSRGGRPDLAGDSLADVTAPTLLIVGGRDDVVLELNREAQGRLGGPSHLEVVPNATHLFEEPGALEQVADLAADWFARHLGDGL
jgi:putative phosphoribosyl transferase